MPLLVSLLQLPRALLQNLRMEVTPLGWNSLVHSRVGVGTARCVTVALLLNRPTNPKRLMNGRVGLKVTPSARCVDLVWALLLRKKQFPLTDIPLMLVKFYT